MTTDVVADEYVSLCRQGRFFDEAMQRLWSPDTVRVAPLETGGEPVEIRGSEAIEENSRGSSVTNRSSPSKEFS